MNDKRLLAERVVPLLGKLNDESGTRVIAKLLFLRHEDSTQPITLAIDSPGGSIAVGFAVIDTMRDVNLPVSTLCVGEAHGMAAIILACGSRGQRDILPGSRLSLTPVTVEDNLALTAEDRRAHANVLKHLIMEIVDVTGRSSDSVFADLTTGRTFDPAGAVEYGLADRVLG